MSKKLYTNLGTETREYMKHLAEGYCASDWQDPKGVIVDGKMLSYQEFLFIADQVEYKKYRNPVKISPVISQNIFIVFSDPDHWIERDYNGNTEKWVMHRLPKAYQWTKDDERMPIDLLTFGRLNTKLNEARFVKTDSLSKSPVGASSSITE